jgi:hypothetical protein
MPVTGATTRNDYVATSGQTVFNYTFQILLATDIKVMKNGTLLTINNDYTVSSAGVAGGGDVTLLSSASAGDNISLFLAMPIDRTTEYQNAGDFLASDVNGDFDKGYIAMNQLQTDIARSIGLKDYDPSVDMTLPVAGSRANKFLKFNAQGLPVADTGTPINEDIITPAQFGALGDGSDDDAAIQAMVAYVKANGGGTIDLEDKVYNVGSTIAFGVPITLLCGTGGGFRARNTGNYTEITGRSGEVQTNPDGGNYTVLFDIDGMAYSSFQGRFILTSVGPTTIMGGEVKYIPNLIAIAQQDGTGPVQALNGYFESLYVTNLHAAFFQPEKAEGFGPVLPYTRTYFARLEIIRCYQAWNFLHVNGFDDCAVGVMRINKCARDAYAKAFDLDCLEAFLAGGKAIATGTFSTTATSTAFTVSADADVVVGDAVMIKGAETYGQGFTTKIATLVGTSGTFEDVCPVTVSDAQFIFASGGYEMDRATFVCAKLYLEGSHYKLLNFTRQATLDCQTLKFSTGEFSCYQGRPITFEHINSLCNIGSVPQSEQGVNGNPLIDGSLGKLIQSYVYIGLRKFTDLEIPPDSGNFFDFYPDHNCTIKLMMTKADLETYGIKPIEVGHTIYDPAGKAGGIREWSTSNSQLLVEYSDATVRVSGSIGGGEIQDKANVMDYGAVGDGVADDTVAARNCIAYAVANGLIAYFPPGDYKITGNILNYLKLVDGGQSPKIVGAGRGLTKFTVVGAQTDYVFIAYGDTTSYGNSSHPSGLLFQGFSVIGDYTNTQNIFDLAMLSYFEFDDVNTFRCKGTSLRMRECWEGDVSGLRVVRSGDDSVYAVVLDYYFSDRKADSACNNINFGKDFQCEASAWSAMYWGRNTRKCLFQGKIHPLLSSTYTVPAFVMDGATNCTVIGANISWKNVKSLRLTNDSGYIPSENIVTNSTISGGVELVGACRRNTIVYNTGGISKQQNAYIATSGQTVFAYTFLAAAPKNVLVTNNGEELVLDTDYTLTGVGDAGGGNVTLTVGATAGDDVVASQVEDQFVTIAGGADNIVFGNNPSGAGVEVTYASGSNFLPTVFHGKDTVATFESNDTFARVEFKEPNGSSRVGTQANKLILEAAHTGGASNAKVSFKIAGSEVAKIDNDGIFNGSCGWYCGAGSPETVVTAAVGSIYTNTAQQGAGTTLYVKESGTGNTGWVAK